MKRSKAWWAALTADERKELVGLEVAKATANGRCLPCLEASYIYCSACNAPTFFDAICGRCLTKLWGLIDKANAAMAKEAG